MTSKEHLGVFDVQFLHTTKGVTVTQYIAFPSLYFNRSAKRTVIVQYGNQQANLSDHKRTFPNQSYNIDSDIRMNHSLEDNHSTDRPFPSQLFVMLQTLEKDGLSHVASWQPHGCAFIVHKKREFVTNILPQ